MRAEAASQEGRGHPGPQKAAHFGRNPCPEQVACEHVRPDSCTSQKHSSRQDPTEPRQDPQGWEPVTGLETLWGDVRLNSTNTEGAQHGVGTPTSRGSTGEGSSPTCIPPALVDTPPLPLGTKTSSGDPAPGLCPPVCSLCPRLGLAGAGQLGLQ